MGRALATRNARIFFAASLAAWTGLWMHRIAVAWLAWELTGSALWVGLVAFCDLAPAAVISPIAGAVADRVDRLRLATVSQAVIGLEAAAVAALVATGTMRIEYLLLLELCGGTAASFAQPARQTLMAGIVGRADLPAAVACNSLIFNVARFIGPALAGPVIAGFGVAPAIACNAVAYLSAVVTMPMLRVDPAQRRGHPATGSLLGEVREGFSYVARHPGLGPLLLYAASLGVLLRAVQELLPPFVERNFGRGAESLALITACFGVGALLAGLWLAARGRTAGATRIAILAGLAQAVATAGFVATGWFPFGLLCAALIGATASLHGISVQQLAQTAADPAMRGRVLALWGMITRACPALGALLLGAAGEAFGLRWPTLVGVALGLLVFAWGWARHRGIEAALEGPPEESLEEGRRR
ncbi:MFS transporter [Pseudoroseomonas rhizosphaerae]|uniref:MFS transporter n=1 Tax=Teichococcus rhizosphaerae TaxID=1335062 RepID=A0A2C6ZE95_9PROT|nr:MFS transporter [Pseudoroseomonas rhizosphaerae]